MKIPHRISAEVDNFKNFLIKKIFTEKADFYQKKKKRAKGMYLQWKFSNGIVIF